MASVNTAAAWILGPELPALAWGATLAMGAGALVASMVHQLVPKRWLAVALVAAACLLAGASAEASAGAVGGRGGPAAALGLHGIGLTALAWFGAALAPLGARSTSRTALARAGALVLLCAALDGAASAWGLVAGPPPWSPEVASRLLDLSPRAFVMEIAGVDWMRHPSVYDAVGTDRISPSLRSPYAAGAQSQGAQVVAVLPALVLGSVLMGLRPRRSASLSAARPRQVQT